MTSKGAPKNFNPCENVKFNGKSSESSQNIEPSVWGTGEANPPYDRLLKAKVRFWGQNEQEFRRELETTAIETARRSGIKNLRVLIFGPRGELEEIVRWTEETMIALNRTGYEYKISRILFDHGTKEVRFYEP
jgi:hypothetical protein